MLPNADTWFTSNGAVQVVVPNKLKNMAIAAEHLLKTRNTLEKILAENSGQSMEKIHADAGAMITGWA